MYEKRQNRKINLYFILADENLFHPHYLAGVLQSLNKRKYKVVGITVAKAKYSQGFMREMLHLWGIIGFIVIGMLSLSRTLIGRVLRKNRLQIKSVAAFFSIPYQESFNVNSSEHLAYLKKKNIDVVISSNGQIFKKELLSLPSIACINRHTALLPKYGGVLPVFWAMRNNESRYGVSIHYMVEKIDQGKVIIQRGIDLEKNNSLFTNYVLGFNESILATVDALEILSKNNLKKQKASYKVEYYSFPSNKQFSQFRKLYKTFSLKDLLLYFKIMW